MSVGPAPARLAELLPAGLVRWGRRLGWAWLALVTVAAVVVVVRRSHPVTPAFPSTAPVVSDGASIDLARYELGARLEVSSYLSPANHHPIFAIDGNGGSGDDQAASGASDGVRRSGRRGREGVDPLMKWVSAKSDRAPFAVVRWPWPVDLDAVRLVHAGRFEHGEYTIRDYDLTCLDADDAPLAKVSVRDNRQPVSTHPLACVGASALRLDFTVETAKDSPRAVVRLYEIEALGRPHRAPGGGTP